MTRPPTRRLYYDDAYTTRFRARLVETLELADGRPAAILQATYFYPTSGGQQHDLGVLGGRSVVDVVELESAIAHVLEAPLMARTGDELHGEIDAGRRAAHRQQHSGQHILSRALEELLDLPTDSARLGENGNTIDLKTETLDPADLERVYARANQVVWDARPVRVQQLESAQAESAELRKKSERSGIVRVIEIDDFDLCPCGGTHVRNSGEVGLIAPIRTESIARGLRLHFLCGARALAHLRERDRLLGELALRFTSGADELAGKFEKLSDENKELKRALAEAEAAQARAAARQWIADAETRRDGEVELRVLLRELPESMAPSVQAATVSLRRESGLLSLLALVGEEKAQFLICRGGGCAIDCGQLLRELLGQVDGRGGGNPESARGSFPASSWPQLVAAINRRFPTL